MNARFDPSVQGEVYSPSVHYTLLWAPLLYYTPLRFTLLYCTFLYSTIFYSYCLLYSTLPYSTPLYSASGLKASEIHLYFPLINHLSLILISLITYCISYLHHLKLISPLHPHYIPLISPLIIKTTVYPNYMATRSTSSALATSPLRCCGLVPRLGNPPIRWLGGNWENTSEMVGEQSIYHLVMTNSSPWKIPTINGG